MAAPSDNLFIGDLPPHVTDESVLAIFSAYGEVASCKAIPAKAGGSKGAALVRFGTLAEAQWVLENLNGNLPEGLDEPVVIQYARNPPGGPANKKGGSNGGWGKGAWGAEPARAAPYAAGGKGWGGAGGGGWGKAGGGEFTFWSLMNTVVKRGVLPGSGKRPDEQCVYVKNLPPDTTDQCLYELFCPFGAIAPRGVKAMLKEDGTCNSVGFVDFQDPISAAAAVESLHGTPLADGNTLHLNLKKSKKDGGKGGAWQAAVPGGVGRGASGEGVAAAWPAAGVDAYLGSLL